MCVFGGDGACLRYLDGSTFRQQWSDTICYWRPDLVLIWLGSNDLNRDGVYDEAHIQNTYELHVQLVDELRSRLGPHGMRLIIMPLIPCTTLRWGMTSGDFFRSIRRFNVHFRRRRLARRISSESFQMNNYGAFREDGSALRDGVHLTWEILHRICTQMRDQYLNQ